MRKICAEKLRHACWVSLGLRKRNCNYDWFCHEQNWSKVLADANDHGRCLSPYTTKVRAETGNTVWPYLPNPVGRGRDYAKFLCRPYKVTHCHFQGYQLRQILGVGNRSSKNVTLGKFWQDLEILKAFLISLEVSFLHGLFLPFFESQNFLPRSLGPGFLTRIPASRWVSDFSICHP